MAFTSDTRIQSIIEAEIHTFGSSKGTPISISSDFVALLEEAHRHSKSGYFAEQVKHVARQWITSHKIPYLYNIISSPHKADIETYLHFIQAFDDIASTVSSVAYLLQLTNDYIYSQGIRHGSPEHLVLANLQHSFSLAITATLCKMAPTNFPHVMHAIYASGLSHQPQAHDQDEEAVATDREPISLDSIAQLSKSLAILGLGDLVIKVASSIVKAHVREYLESSCKSALNMMDDGHSVLQDALEYIETTPLEYLRIIIAPSDGQNKDPVASVHHHSNTASGGRATPSKIYSLQLQKWNSKLRSYVYNALAKLHTSAMFDLVIDYPESLPALIDLRECLRYTNTYQNLVDVFAKAIRTRLLHPGAATTDILQHYVSTIAALQHVDPSGAVLDAVSDPLREYLRTRKDAIRCIVTMLTEEGGRGGNDGQAASSILVELAAAGEGRGMGGDGEDDFCGADADELALQESVRWEPGPLTVAPLEVSGAVPKSMDVISLLVNIYGTKELFVSEYRSMLAERLLAKTDFDADHETRTLELLKVRFGEASLHAAEVMLRDMADSKRINTNVRTVANTATPLKKVRNSLVPLDGLGVTIVSELFWPPIQHEEFELPQEVHAMLSTFGHKYHATKAPRILQWKPSLGTVDLTLTIGSSSIDFSVSPINATLLLHFQKQSEWSLTDLADQLKINAESVRKKMTYWINQGVITEHRNIDGSIVYVRNEELQRPVGVGAGDGDGAMDGKEDENDRPENDTMAHFEPFVLGMLTNFDSLPLDRIHNMLKMFVTDPPYDRTIEELSSFMSRLSTEDKVVVEAGVYKRRTS